MTQRYLLLGLLLLALAFFGLYDAVSTLAAYNYLGSFEYEASPLFRWAFDTAGVAGFLITKFAATMTMLMLTYYLSVHRESFTPIGVGIFVGTIIAGAFVGTSNLHILVDGTSLWVLGLNSGQVATAILFLCSITGLIYSILIKNAVSRAEASI